MGKYQCEEQHCTRNGQNKRNEGKRLQLLLTATNADQGHTFATHPWTNYRNNRKTSQQHGSQQEGETHNLRT